MGAVVGIDLGTTNTVVAAIRDGRPVALPDESGSTLIPSIVSFLPSGAVLVGNAAKERRSQDSRNTIYSVKRLIGRTWDSAEVQKALTRFPFEMREGPGRATFVLARAETYTLPEISAFVLRKAKSIAELELGEPVDRAVITVPANFNDLQRAATKVAGRVAGLEVLRILNEPTAAALAFGHTRGNRERIAVFDFGGGTFDLTLLLLTDDVFEVLATAGDTFLGGDDIDAAIVERMMRGLEPSSSVNPRANAETFERLREAAEQVKLNLSDAAETRLFLADHEIASRSSIDFAMTRDELDAIVDPIVGRTFKVCHDALTMAKLSPKDIDHVLLVGGSTRIPLVKRRVEEYFGKRARADLDPHEVVALGAAQQAMALTQLRATASGIPVAPPPRAQLASSSTEAAEVPNKLRKQTDPGVGDGDAVAAARVSVAPPEVPLSAPTPTTQNFGSRDRRTTGIGLGPSDADLPAVAVAPVAPQRNALETTTAPPSTMSGLGPHRGRVSTQQGPVGARPPTEPKPAPLIIRREPVGDFSREASDRATRVPGVKPDLTATLASAIVQPDPPSPSTDAPRTSPQFVPGIDAAIASQDLPVAKYPAQLRRPATPVDSVTELEGPKTDPQFRDAQGPIASTPDVPTPRTDPLFGTALQARTAHKETAAPSTNPIFAGAARRREPQPVPSTGKTEEPSEALSLGRAAGETIPDEVGAWEQAAYDVGADIGLPIVSGPPRSIADRSIADLRSHTEVSAESAQQVPPQRIGAKGKTVDLLADLPLVVSESAEARAERGPAQRPPNPQPVRSGLDPAPAAAHNAPTHPALPRQQPGPAATRLGLQAPEAPQRFGLPDPSQPDPNLGDSVPHAQTYTSSAYADDDDDMTADEPTMIRRPAQSSVDLSEARGALPTGPFDNLPELSTSNQGLPDLPAQDHTADLPAMTADLASSPAQPRRSGRPSSLNEEEIRARYGNLPLIVGGRRVGASASELAGEPAPRTTTRTTAARPVERTTHAPIEFDPRGDDPATEAPGSLGPDPRSIPQPVMSHRDHGKAASIGPTAALTEPAANPSTAARDPRPIAPGARRPNSAAIANALPPLPSPPSALPIPSIEPEELDPSEIDFGPLISPPRKPDPQDRSALAAGQFEDSIAAKPRLHSSRPTAKQSAIEELELPIPDLPPLQPVATPNRPIYHAPTVPTRAAASSNDSPQAGAALRSPERAPERTLAQPKPQIVASAPVPTTTELHKGFNLDATMPLGATALPTGPWQPPASKQQVTEPATFVHAATRNIEVPPLLASLPPSAASRAALLIDVTPLSLCVETVGGYVDVLVARNTPVPCERTRDFITAHDNQQTVVVRVAQGESKLFHENVLLGEVQLTGIPAAPRGQSRIAVTFGIDSDGILHVRALEMGSGQSALVDLRLAGAPSPPEIAQMMARHAAKGQA